MTTPSNGNVGGRNVLVTGGAGFVGAHLATSLSREGARVIALDNLRRRGSELNLPRLTEGGVRFVHGDIRNPDDLDLVDEIDVLIECSAEPSVLAGYHDSPRYVVEANLGGAVNCFELARRRRAALIFLSTSRVYPIAPVNAIAVEETDTRFEIAERQALPGVSAKGISESFGLNGARSLYGATKLAAELVLHEYGDMYGLRYVINRLGVITGPGQMGKVDQGVFALWMARHYFRMPLVYKGWGGTGKQVRDLVHVDDVWNLVGAQLGVWEQIDRKTYNVGGGRAVSLSLREATALCQEITGNRVALDSSSDTHPSDVRAYLTDHSHVTNELGWIPTRDARTTLADIYDWIKSDEHRLAPIFKS